MFAVDGNIRKDDLHTFLLFCLLIVLQHSVNAFIHLSGFVFLKSIRQFALSVVFLPVQCSNRMITQSDQSCFARDLQQIIRPRINRTVGDQTGTSGKISYILALFRRSLYLDDLRFAADQGRTRQL